MASPEAARALEDLATAVGESQADRAVEAAVRALRAKADPLELVRSAALAAASRFDPALGLPPHGLLALTCASNLTAVLEPRSRPLPILQAIVLAAAEEKAAKAAGAPTVVRGEVSHLGRSFLFAARAGDRVEAEAIFLGILDERKERRLAGDMLFRAASEDMGDGGNKLIVAVKLWQLARTLGFQEGRRILRPAVQYLVSGARDAGPYRTLMSVLGKEWVDLDALAAGGRPLDDAGRAKVSKLPTVPTAEACVASMLGLLREGYAAASLAEGLILEAARRSLAAEGYDLEAVQGLIYAHAARHALTFTRTNERLYALFQAALRLRSPEPIVSLPAIAAVQGEGDELCAIAGDLEARSPKETAARVASYLSRRYSPTRLLELLAHYASRDSSLVNRGHNLILADVCSTEFAATKAPEVAMVLAKMVAASSPDWTAYEAWAPTLGV